MVLSRYIKLIIENAESIIRNLNLKREETIKPLNIEDIAWHLTSDNEQVNPFTLYNLLMKKVTEKKVYRKPYLGIMSDSIDFLKSLSLISKTISIPTLLLGTYKDIQVSNLFKLVDYGLIAFKKIEEVDIGLKLNELILYNVRIPYFIKNNTVIFVSDYLISVPIILYLIRPVMNILYKTPFLLYPLREIQIEFKDDIIYLDSRSRPVKTYNELRYIGLKVEFRKAIVEDLYATPRD